MRRILVALLLPFVMAACQSSTVAMAPPGQDAAGKQFNPPPPGTAAVYFYNPAAASPVLNVSVDGLYIGQLGTQTWMRAEINAGHHVFRCRGGNSGNGIWLNLAPGQIRFIDVQMLPGQYVCTIRETGPDVGRASVLNGSRALQQ
ncbi:MAG: hypothetical protein IKE60_10640 [Reyranella sp.]|jgi:hypothetical protein|uniref:hypothetical protein n=1 Tax=Reyranella sp. TaxID=1929291 RepID=UPI0009659149|nr:hypothetical protein [Reyranella sp.]MBN9539675.1 hypothetical protein [Alphaproteobacteria bacterium]MBR2815098.1 hypothetical protein [Reyranella sp.]OJU45725.1 MAG: hypothetical protein BGN99_17225 [Alphaproteobacteria bacterium 65-37]